MEPFIFQFYYVLKKSVLQLLYTAEIVMSYDDFAATTNLLSKIDI